MYGIEAYLRWCFSSPLSDKHAPMQTRKLKNRSNPWMNGDILKMIYERDYLKRKAVSCADNGLWQWYKYFRNKITYTIRYAKNMYYDTKIAQINQIQSNYGK